MKLWAATSDNVIACFESPSRYFRLFSLERVQRLVSDNEKGSGEALRSKHGVDIHYHFELQYSGIELQVMY